MLIARSRRKESRCNAVLFIMTMACFCLKEGRSEGSKHHLSDIANGDSKSCYRLPINTIGNVHNASQCADSDDRFYDSPGNCCGQHVDDRQCRNEYTVSSVSFEECQKTDEGCSFANSCFSCVVSPPGKDSPHPPPLNHKIYLRMQEQRALKFTGLVRTKHMLSSGSRVSTDRLLAL